MDEEIGCGRRHFNMAPKLTQYTLLPQLDELITVGLNFLDYGSPMFRGLESKRAEVS